MPRLNRRSKGFGILLYQVTWLPEPESRFFDQCDVNRKNRTLETTTLLICARWPGRLPIQGFPCFQTVPNWSAEASRRLAPCGLCRGARIGASPRTGRGPGAVLDV